MFIVYKFTIYYIKFSGISSGSKSIKMLSTSDDIILSTHVISFLTNQLAEFSHTVFCLLLHCEDFIK